MSLPGSEAGAGPLTWLLRGRRGQPQALPIPSSSTKLEW
jgi:hypothetical protein